MASKTKTQQFEDQLAAAGEAVVQERQDALQTIAELREKVDRQQVILEDAQDAVAVIDRQWSSGDDSTSAEDRRIAELEAEKAKKVLKGLQQKINAVRVPNVDTTAAEQTAEALRQSFDGWVPVYTTCAEAGAVEPPAGILPVAVVSQSKPIEISGRAAIDGTCRATVDVKYYRGGIHRELSEDRLEAIQNPDGVTAWGRLHVQSDKREDEKGQTFFVDSGRQVSLAAVLDLPFIEQVQDASGDIAGVILGAALEGKPRDAYMATYTDRTSMVEKVSDDGARTVSGFASFAIGRAREVRRDVQVGMEFSHPEGIDFKAAAESVVGEFVEGVGRITECRFVGFKGTETVEDRMSGNMSRIPVVAFEVTAVSAAVPPEGAVVR